MGRLALSLKQPWAALLVAGRKSIEVRRWTTAFRGELLIHAARVDDDRPGAWAHVDDSVRELAELRGGIIGVGTLAEVRVYRDLAGFVADRPGHLNEAEWFEPRGLYGFRFEELRAVPYCRVPGFFKLFEVELEVAKAGEAPTPVPLPLPVPDSFVPFLATGPPEALSQGEGEKKESGTGRGRGTGEEGQDSEAPSPARKQRFRRLLRSQGRSSGQEG